MRLTFKPMLAILVLAMTVVSLFLLAPTASFAQGASPQKVVGPLKLSSSDDANASYPNVQSVGSHVYVAWTEGTQGIRFRESPNGGSTWVPSISSKALNISSLGTVTQYPMISVNGSYVYVVWSQSLYPSGVQLLFAASSNYGASFSKPIAISPINASHYYITPVIASYGSDVYVAYIDNQCTANQTRCTYVTSSMDNGAQWSVPYLVGVTHEPQLYAHGEYAYVISDSNLSYTQNYGQTWTNVALGGRVGAEPWIWGSGSNVYAAGEGKGNKSSINITTTSNNGETWQVPYELSTTVPDSWAPMVWAYGNSAWIAERSNPGGSAGQVWLYTTTNNGTSWNTPMSLSGKGASGSAETFPYTVYTSDGKNVFVAWSHQVKSGYWTFMISYSSNGGITWTAPPGINISHNSKGEAGFETDIATGAISAYGDTCYAAWQYSSGSSNQIYFAAVTE